MAYTTIDNPGVYFNTVTYTGNVDHSSANGSQAISGVGFQPDWVWIKPYVLGYAAGSHNLTDSVRGAGVGLFSDSNSAEYNYGTSANGGSLIAFGSDGFTLGGASQVNENSNTYAAWNWLGGGSASSNGNGSITSSLSASTTSGFSIVTYTGNGTAGATVGHGLGSIPKAFIVKVRNTSNEWVVYHASLGATKFIELNSSGASQTNSTRFNNTEPTSSVFSLGTAAGLNTSSDTHVAYCFAEKKGFSKFGKYTGNGSSDGTFVYTGFRPAWLMAKNTDAGDHWVIFDNKRKTTNTMTNPLFPNNDSAQGSSTSYTTDFLSNGFKFGGSDGATNSSGNVYIYFAFAESPFVNSNGVPTNAR